MLLRTTLLRDRLKNLVARVDFRGGLTSSMQKKCSFQLILTRFTPRTRADEAEPNAATARAESEQRALPIDSAIGNVSHLEANHPPEADLPPETDLAIGKDITERRQNYCE